MRRKIVSGLLAIALSTFIFSGNVEARRIDDGVPDLIEGCSTAYCLQGVTASGQNVRKGICAGSDEYFGKVIILYKRLPDGRVGEKIGIYECLDKGGGQAIKDGYLIDVWCPDMDACQDHMDKVYEDGCQGKVYIQVIDAEG